MLLMVVAFVWTFSRRFTLRYVRNAPTIFTTGGILGTFCGISLALFTFNPEDLQHSLPAFLSGMKTAFYISLLGVLFSLFIKVRFAILGIPERFRTPGSDPGTELVRHHLTLHGLLSGGMTEEERQPLSVHLWALRKENREGLGEIRETLGKYLAQMAENNSRALVAALETVIKNFETQLNSSASQSMKDLAEAVKEIVKWQESAKDAMPAITAELVRVAGMLGEIGESQKSFVGQAEAFRKFFNRQGELLARMTEERDRVETSVTAFMKVLESGKTLLPDLQQFVITVSNTVSQESQTMMAQMEKTSRAMNESIEKNRASFELALERELTLSITGLGQQLTALSEKFVEDYTPLTERLREVLSIAERAGR